VTSRRYALEFAPKALRALRKLDRPVVEHIKAATESLREDPRPAGAKMLTGMPESCGSGSQVTTGSCARSTMTG
jgi:mRNA-degrading endonuclease RelE of RelBE toxin-antitoxin system